MRAAVNRRYGPPTVVGVEDVRAPKPGATDVVVRVSAAAVTSADARLRAARFPRGFAPFARLAFGVTRPRRRTLGSAFSGVVVSTGPAVTGVAVGDRVCAMTGMAFGAHAELVAVTESRLVAVPADVTDTDAAAVLFGGTTAMHFLTRLAALSPDKKVLVNGASGAIGTMAVQIASRAGAHVSGVSSAANADLIVELGASDVVDYNVTELSTLTERYDIVLDTVGNITPAAGRALLTESGVVLLAVATLGQLVRARGNVKAGTAAENPADMAALLDGLSRGTLVAVIDRILPLTEIAAAHARVDSGRKVGNVLVTP